MVRAQLQEQAEQRMQERVTDTRQVRQEVLKRTARKDWLEIAPTHQTVRMLNRKGRGDLAAQLAAQSEHVDTEAVLAEAAPAPEDLIPDIRTVMPLDSEPLDTRVIEELVLEQIIGRSEIMPVRFVHTGSRAARSVGRIAFGIDRANGTGFLVSPRMVLTNNHVLPDEGEASRNYIQFGHLTRSDGSLQTPITFRFDPGSFFETSPVDQFDYTLVAINPVNEEGRRTEEFGTLTLLGERGKEQQGQRVNIVHHPQGNPKQVSLRENFLVVALDDFLHYMSDTMHGSSGSPVFNDEWEVVGLHHAGRKIRDPEEVDFYREALAALGRNVEPGAVVLVNEGTRISTIVQDLRQRSAAMTEDRRALLAEVLSEANIADIEPDAAEVALAGDGAHRVIRTPGVAPVSITINVGTGQATPTITASGRAGISEDRRLELFVDEINSQKSVLRGLSFLQESREGNYVPSPGEIEDRKENYYGNDLINDIGSEQLSTAEAYDALADLQQDTLQIASSFPESLGGLESLRGPMMESSFALESDALYARSRAHLYTWADLRSHRMLECVYTGTLIAPEQLMLRDLLVQLGFMDLLPQRFRNNRYLNCEHIVPQSWFDHASIPKADMHHLITADGQANNFRSDTVYRDLNGAGVLGPDDRPPYLGPAGRKSGDEFEPANNKGVVARATLYFLVAHPGLISDDKYPPEHMATLQTWCATPPSEYEIHRNEAIFDVQGNRNPLIDFPEWAQKIDFARGMAN